MSRAEYIWAHMAARYGHTWVSQFGDSPDGIAGRAWSDDLQGLSRAQLDAGIAACKREAGDFPPSAPRFRAMCLGVPTFAEVNRELLTVVNAERSAFARLVWQHVDGYQHRHAAAKDAERMRRDAFEAASRYVLDGGALPGPVAGVLEHDAAPKPVGIPATREGRVQRMSDLLGEAFNPVAAARRDLV
ncbi:hypothetical protein [Lysobacter enzymogenes]|uniref:hypothetical protein n=1 Tax=Lysobacter enzymogenes TaxID=69 RepID=UPI00089BB811|nr:hypothetical protein [Lysobacter enzymogenes]SDW94237.1 hypothetical protein SAMN05421681_103291 [Lysobacter enzymogenes]